MPNCLPDLAGVLHVTEGKGDEKGERFFGFGGYIVCTLSKDRSIAIGCLNFHMNLYHVKANSLRIFIELEGVTVSNDYRRRRIASAMGFLVGRYIAKRISFASNLLSHIDGRVVMMADFDHEGGEACFAQMANVIELGGETMFPHLEVLSDAGW